MCGVSPPAPVVYLTVLLLLCPFSSWLSPILLVLQLLAPTSPAATLPDLLQNRRADAAIEAPCRNPRLRVRSRSPFHPPLSLMEKGRPQNTQTPASGWDLIYRSDIWGKGLGSRRGWEKHCMLSVQDSAPDLGWRTWRLRAGKPPPHRGGGRITPGPSVNKPAGLRMGHKASSCDQGR